MNIRLSFFALSFLVTSMQVIVSMETVEYIEPSAKIIICYNNDTMYIEGNIEGPDGKLIEGYYIKGLFRYTNWRWEQYPTQEQYQHYASRDARNQINAHLAQNIVPCADDGAFDAIKSSLNFEQQYAYTALSNNLKKLEKKSALSKKISRLYGTVKEKQKRQQEIDQMCCIIESLKKIRKEAKQ